jgi:DNA polymerase
MARDVIAEAIIRLESAGLPVLFHAHDEVILEVDLDNKEEAKAEAIRLMTQTPEWAEGLPLAVEGDFCDRYTK